MEIDHLTHMFGHMKLVNLSATCLATCCTEHSEHGFKEWTRALQSEVMPNSRFERMHVTCYHMTATTAHRGWVRYHDGDGDDMLWMQLMKVGNVFDRAKAPAWTQPRPSH
jgi:hypothetical protein